MKKILLSLAAIIVALSSFAAVGSTDKEIDYILKKEDSKYIATFKSEYTLYYVVGDYQFTLGLSDDERAKYIKEANEMDMPSTDDNNQTINFVEVDTPDAVWSEENASEGYASWSFDCSSAEKAHSFTKTLNLTSSKVISRSVEYDHHYVLYIKLLDKQKNVVKDSEQKYSVDDSSTLTGKIDLTVDENAAVEVYNLNGVRMQGDNLPAGVYIRRQGNKVSKYVVR